MPPDELREEREVNKARRAASGAVGDVAAITDQVESELAIRGFRRGVDLFTRHLDAVRLHDQLELRDRPLDRLPHLLFVGKHKILSASDRRLARSVAAAILSTEPFAAIPPDALCLVGLPIRTTFRNPAD